MLTRNAPGPGDSPIGSSAGLGGFGDGVAGGFEVGDLASDGARVGAPQVRLGQEVCSCSATDVLPALEVPTSAMELSTNLRCNITIPNTSTQIRQGWCRSPPNAGMASLGDQRCHGAGWAGSCAVVRNSSGVALPKPKNSK